jgi:hypothetical protein
MKGGAGGEEILSSVELNSRTAFGDEVDPL